MTEENAEADAITQAVIERKQRAEERKRKEEREKGVYLDQLGAALCDHFGFDREAALFESGVQQDGYEITLGRLPRSLHVRLNLTVGGSPREVAWVDWVYSTDSSQKKTEHAVFIQNTDFTLEEVPAFLKAMAALQEVADVFSKVPTPPVA